MKAFELFNEIVPLCNFEKNIERLLFELPQSYIEMAKNYDISTVKCNRVRIYFDKEKSNYAYLISFFNFDELLRLYKQFYFQFPDSQIIENEITIIGDTSAPISICIGIGTVNFGQIFIFGWDIGVIKVANSFEEFIDGLQPESDGVLDK
jgi:hypothetical protein